MTKTMIVRCKRVPDCVTVVTKTARRPYLVMRLAQSIRDKKGLQFVIRVSSTYKGSFTF